MVHEPSASLRGALAAVDEATDMKLLKMMTKQTMLMIEQVMEKSNRVVSNSAGLVGLMAEALDAVRNIAVEHGAHIPGDIQMIIDRAHQFSKDYEQSIKQDSN